LSRQKPASLKIIIPLLLYLAVFIPSASFSQTDLTFDGLRVTTSGDGQEGRTGTWLKEPFTIRVTDAAGNPLTDVPVEFWLENGSKSELSAEKTLTDARGIASTRLKLGKNMEQHTLGAFIKHTSLGSGVIHMKAWSYDPKKIIMWLIGGLGLFLYGMSLMSSNLQKVAGPKLKNILRLLTINRFAAVGMGAFVTALIQSSSATSVMVVGFVNAGLLQLQRAIGVIIGANIASAGYRSDHRGQYRYDHYRTVDRVQARQVCPAHHRSGLHHYHVVPPQAEPALG